MKILAIIKKEDYETKENSIEKRYFKSVADVQNEVNEINNNSGFEVIREAEIYEVDTFIGVVSQNGRFWPVKDKKYKHLFS